MYRAGNVIHPGYAITCAGRFVRLDASSGGYPYLGDLLNAHFWKDKAEALNYLEMFKGEINGIPAMVEEITIWFSTEG